jgi:hypothetical protein
VVFGDIHAALRPNTRTWTREFNHRGIRFNTLRPDRAKQLPSGQPSDSNVR